LFKQFRNLDRNSPRYQKARAIVAGSTAENAAQTDGSHLLAAFARDVAGGSLPQVSWIVAPKALSEHPDAPPALGEALVSHLVDILVQHPDVWAKTVFIINYDENDGFFDHVPPPVPANDPEHGHSMTPGLGEVYGGVPVGLGPRVPMIIVSPWTKGGWVNSELFDHTSVLRFLEQRFGVMEPNITPWRRAVTGDLTSAFDFATPNDAQIEPLPATASYVAQAMRASTLASPATPNALEAQKMPVQEAGQRLARALPYAIRAAGSFSSRGLDISFYNEGAVGATFLLYVEGERAGPRHYTILRRASYRANLRVTGTQYGATLFGPHGFFRHFAGPATGKDALIVQEHYDIAQNALVVELVHRGAAPMTVRIVPGIYPHGDTQVLTLAPGARTNSVWAIEGSHHWYDVTVTIDEVPGFVRRLAGHMETGRPSRSDPGFGRG
jgi:phospholipase C